MKVFNGLLLLVVLIGVGVANIIHIKQCRTKWKSKDKNERISAVIVSLWCHSLLIIGIIMFFNLLGFTKI